MIHYIIMIEKKNKKKRGDLNGGGGDGGVHIIMSCNRMYPFNIITGG